MIRHHRRRRPCGRRHTTANNERTDCDKNGLVGAEALWRGVPATQCRQIISEKVKNSNGQKGVEALVSKRKKTYSLICLFIKKSRIIINFSLTKRYCSEFCFFRRFDLQLKENYRDDDASITSHQWMGTVVQLYFGLFHYYDTERI